MKKFYLLLILLLCINHIQAQDSSKHIFAEVTLSAGLSTSDSLSFWQWADQYGGVPSRNYGMAQIELGKQFTYQKKWDWSAGFEASGYTGLDSNVILNQYFVKGRHKGWTLQIGAQNIPTIMNGLSSSNGNITFSNNARAIPGIMLATDGFLQVFRNKPNFQAKAWYGEFSLNDPRSTMGARLHQAGFELKFNSTKPTQFVIGMSDYAQWGGVSPRYGDMNYGFKEYLRMILMLPGGSEASDSDQMNVAGSHLGNYSLRVEHQGKDVNWKVYVSHPFEDGSGMGWQNWPDNLYGVYIDLKKERNWIKAINYEITYTANMSGSWEGENGGGMDNYFNNGAYQSGWSYYGKSIGTPYMPFTIDDQGISKSVELGYNRLLATNIAWLGTISKQIPYQFKASYVQYYGWFGSEFETKPYNISLHIQTNLSNIIKEKRLEILLSINSDIGSFYNSNFGGYIKLNYSIY